MGFFSRPRRLQMHQKRIRTDRTSSYSEEVVDTHQMSLDRLLL